MRKIFTWLSLLLITITAGAQDFSNKGKDFWISYAAHIDEANSTMGVYITSDVDASGTVTVGNQVINYTVAANSVRRVFIGSTGTVDASNLPVYLNTQDGIQTGAGIHVTANRPVAVYAHIIRTSRSGATLVLPVNVWGKEYIVPSYRNMGNSASYGEINIMAADTNTVVEITPSIASRNGLHAAGQPFTITLVNPGDVYQLQFQSSGDISGTRVRSVSTGASGCKPITVYSATTWSGFDCTAASGGDNLYQQLFPISAWGKNFLTAPFINRNYDIIRVYVNDPTTVVNKSEAGITSPLTGLVNNRYYEYKTIQPTKIVADKPVSVVQYITSQSCYTNNVSADPEMVVLSPIEQTINNITVFSAHRNFVPVGQSAVTQCYLNIIIPATAAASFRINGSPPTGAFVPIPNSTYSYLQENVTNITISNPVQTLTADSAFAAIAYGYGSVESYGYNAGTNVKDLFQHIIIRNQFASVDFPATCVNTPFNLAITLPYQAQSLNWDFHGLFPNITNNAPTPDSSYLVDNRTVYVYRLPNVFTFPNIGSYQVSVTAINPTSDGCSGINQIDYNIEVYDKPRARFGFVHSGCLSDSVRFYDSTNGLGRPVRQWRWQFGDNTIDSVRNPVKLYASSGTYNVNLRAITDVGCVADTTIPVTITPAPVARFGVSPTLCPGTAITFTDSSRIASGTLVKWYWDYGNGRRDTVLTNAPQTTVYDTAGIYVVKLVVEAAGGCKSVVFTDIITIHPRPKADFQNPVICMPAGTGQFTNSSTIPNGSAAQLGYNWNFGDGGSSTAVNPTHQYAGTGPYTVSLVAISSFGCRDTATKVLNSVYPQPVAQFTTAEVCLGDTTRFTDQSTAANSTVNKWFWNFGDGATDTVANPVHRYQAAGTYTVRFYVQSATGCYSDTLTRQVTVNALPTADFTIGTPSCLGQGITLTSTSVPNSGTLTGWQWNFGDGIALDTTSGTVVHTYDTVKTYAITLTVVSDKGCRSPVVVKQLTIAPRPVAAFGIPQVCLSDPFAEFTDSSTTGGSTTSLQYLWNFGDPNATPANPNTATIRNGRHQYTVAGVYTVTLTVTTASGCSASVSRSVTINGGSPVADFAIQNTGSICSADTVRIQNRSSVNYGNITKVEIIWDQVNNPGTVVTDNAPVLNKVYQHRYPAVTQASRQYTIRFLAYSGGVCVNSTEKTVTVYTNPVAGIAISPVQVCLGEPVRLTDTSTNAGITVSSWNWNFGDNGSGNTRDVTHLYNQARTFAVRLQTQTPEGCVSPVATGQVVVNAVPLVNAGPDVYVLQGGQAQLAATASGSTGLRYAWSPATWLSDSTRLQPLTRPLTDITYTLTVTGAGNCIASDVVNVRMLQGLVIPNAFSPNGDGVNDRWVIQHLETYPGSTVQVFDRYGRIVFTAPVGYSVSWDGNLNGQPLPIGTYYYVIDPKNGVARLSGSVTILR